MKKDAIVLPAIKLESVAEDGSYLTQLMLKHKPVCQLTWKGQ